MLRSNYDAKDEWHGAAWLAEKYINFSGVGLYLRGTRSTKHSYIQTIHFCTAIEQFTLTGIYWNKYYGNLECQYTTPYGCPLFELLVGTFKAAQTTARLICFQPNDWIYQLNREKNRQVFVSTDPTIRYTHRFALKKVGYGLPR